MRSPLSASVLTALFVAAYVAAMWALTMLRPKPPRSGRALAERRRRAAWLPSARVVRRRR